MVRHLFVTALIFFVVYVGLLLAIEHPFLGLSSIDPMADQSKTETTKVDRVAIEDKTKKADNTVSMFIGPTIVGVSASVSLANEQQEIHRVWQQLLANQSLVNQVNWAKGNIEAYAYYREFDSNMTQARLTVGFDLKDLIGPSHLSPVLLPAGHYKSFPMNIDTGVASNAAWTAAYSHKNLIERHMLNSNGKPVSADAIVILK